LITHGPETSDATRHHKTNLGGGVAVVK
jgi:hypothetical protein